jgi:hypothetical protein
VKQQMANPGAVNQGAQSTNVEQAPGAATKK